MKEVLLSGCMDREYSYNALINGVYHGAITYFLLKAIREANYKITYDQLINRLHFILDDERYNQHLQLERKTVNKKMQIFA